MKQVISAPREWGIWSVLGWHFEGSGYFGFVPIADNAWASLWMVFRSVDVSVMNPECPLGAPEITL